ncbi:ShlB/FhaC/HecB family hemolysin secretion/activation protein [Myxosarcina sp. GI1]|uniref:ShlB/FhaC/HecB family hemolysin secretion/activation protein n=1 Tax=Myxosarcina sp. GI1 TaxID=1541065 RepID=UPI00155A8CC2|nr:ShlB/FhaC/HecB family hemolysin secretion/activation protein [Myxosarcina sp. GI1]
MTVDPVQAQIKAINDGREAPIEVEQIELEGNTVFSDTELKRAIDFPGTEEISLERLVQLRIQITKHYEQQGYLQSGAFIPVQEITDGKVKVRVIEGRLTKVNIEGLTHLNRNYIVARLPDLEKPTKQAEVERALGKLRKDPFIKNIEGGISEISPGKNLLTINIEENEPLTSEFALTNSYSPSVGTFGGTLSANYHLFGFGDRLGLEYTRTEGLTRYDGSYLFPVNSSNGTIGLSYINANTRIIEKPISVLDIQANYEAFQLSARQPVIINDNSDLAFELQFELIASETFVREDFSFAFVDGLPDGKSKISALRLIQEYFNRGDKSSLVLRSQFSVGLDLFDPTVTEVGIDGLFWSWQGQGQWLRKLDNFLLVSRLNMQFSEDKLLPVEQISLGGTGSVGGYRQNLAIGDNGIIGSLELQMPLINKRNWNFKLIPFVNAGTLWNNSNEIVNFNTLASVGLGLGYELGNTIEARIDYGIPLIDAEAPEDFSTEERITFQLLIQP